MPRQVDHEERRRHIAATALELVATGGLEALTFRNVAAVAGASTTILTHYFADKKDLLHFTYQVGAERSGARFDAVRDAGGGLRECLEAVLPLDKERQRHWRMLTCYWAMAVSDARMARAEANHVRSAQGRIERLIGEEYRGVTAMEREMLARRLITLVHGLGAHSALDPEHWSPAKQRRVLEHELRSLPAMQLREDGPPVRSHPAATRRGAKARTS